MAEDTKPSQHPWRIDRNHSGRIIGIMAADPKHDLDHVCGFRYPPHEDDARLIAAAPDLWSFFLAVMKEVRAAIQFYRAVSEGGQKVAKNPQLTYSAARTLARFAIYAGLVDDDLIPQAGEDVSPIHDAFRLEDRVADLEAAMVSAVELLRLDADRLDIVSAELRKSRINQLVEESGIDFDQVLQDQSSGDEGNGK